MNRTQNDMFAQVKNVKDFIKWSELQQPSMSDHVQGVSRNRKGFITIKGIEFRNVTFWGKHISSLNFEKCKFIECEFNNVDFESVDFKDVEMIKCHFSSVAFYTCVFYDVVLIRSRMTYAIFADSQIVNSIFKSCFELLELYFGGCSIDKLSFEKSLLTHSRINSFLQTEDVGFYFNGAELSDIYFDMVDLRKSYFRNCEIKGVSIIQSLLSNSTIDESNVLPFSKGNSIDIQSIAESEAINKNVLAGCFGIIEPDIKNFCWGLTNPIRFQSIFISYSFEDRKFANRLNDLLRQKGVTTFLWEKDAPGGKYMKEIMSDNIKKYDKILFISSKNSIRSKACQFELSEGRKKQEKLWREIYFPIHIDDYLFTVKQSDIRPIEMQIEYWNNIYELLQINSLDFSDFNKLEVDFKEFELKVEKLVQSLMT